ncbi:FecR domain-containing protein [Pedobacter sp. SD-b]|uniref:FecR domain-containing protein n=1 Tax=Pedobacter segetis TaxID=2793069 RepID=A0ABS1BNC1_9SPHI|nr:FecR family protein [Pedobacter segetis]MBK0384267.1 FecR domain-containing protein [Pedobacter segetis]
MDYKHYTAEDFASDESFINYFLSQNAEDVEFWEAWKSHHPEKLDEVYNAHQLLEVLKFNLPEAELEQEFLKMDQFLSVPNQSADFTKNYHFNQFKVFLVLLAGFVLMVASWEIFRWNKENTIMRTEMIVRHNPFGQRSIIQLSDGTQVSLNANSTLTFPKEFGNNSRKVELDGEAFFEVSKDKSRPFTVKTANLFTTVLGTKFNVNSHDINGTIQVALVEGKVKITEDKKNGSILLLPNHKISYSKKAKTFAKSGFDIEQTVAWKNGEIVFKNSSFEDVAQKLYQAYGINLQKEQLDQNWHFTGKFINTDYLSIIKSICYAKKLNYQVQNDTIIIKR